MRICRLAAAAVLSLSCVLVISSCTQGPEPEAEPGGLQRANEAGEPTDEAGEPIVYAHFDASDFPFRTIVPDRGEGKGGG